MYVETKKRQGELAMVTVAQGVQGYSKSELKQRHAHLTETINLINRNLQADSLHKQDRQELERNRELFDAERQYIGKLLGVKMAPLLSI